MGTTTQPTLANTAELTEQTEEHQHAPWVLERVQALIPEAERQAEALVTYRHIAESLGIDQGTLKKYRSLFTDFSDAIKRGHAKARVTIGEKLLAKASNGDVAALIYLSKQDHLLGFSDQRTVNQNVTVDYKVRTGILPGSEPIDITPDD